MVHCRRMLHCRGSLAQESWLFCQIFASMAQVLVFVEGACRGIDIGIGVNEVPRSLVCKLLWRENTSDEGGEREGR